MKTSSQVLLRAICLLFIFSIAAGLKAQNRYIDQASSVIRVRVYKSGLFSFLAHDHLIEAHGLNGSAVTDGSPGVEFTLSARQLKVVDPGTSDNERAEIQKAMEENVLELSRYPEIRFHSTSVSVLAPGRWQVNGNLLLHGRTLPISFDVEESNGRFKGQTKLRQTEFGIEPIRIAAGTDLEILKS